MSVLKEFRILLEDCLADLNNKRNISPATLDIGHKIVETIKYIDEICEKNDFEDDYSGRYMSRRGYSYESNGGGYSGCRMPMMEMYDEQQQPSGRYSSYGRENYNRMYSREGATSNMTERLREMMNQTSDEREREIIRKCIEHLQW